MPPRRSSPSRSGRSQKVRYAVVGQGYIAQKAVLPAFRHARRNSELVALVSGDAVKRRALARKYRVEHACDYDDYDALLGSGLVDAVFLAVPNHLHLDFTVRAAQQGIHVLCEKPMATSIAECAKMIDATRDVQLMIAYRLHFEPANMYVVELARSGKLGEIRFFDSVFSNPVEDPDNIRLQRETGGGTLPDIGIYCINAARYLLRDEPIEAEAWTARGAGERFREVEEMTAAKLRFDGERFASFVCSFGGSEAAIYHLVGTKGMVTVENAYDYATSRKVTVTIDGKRRTRTFGKIDQFAPELLHFSECVLTGAEPIPSGMEGLIDVAIIEALYQSAKLRRPLTLELPERTRRPGATTVIEKPAVREPRLVHAKAPSDE